MEDSDIPIREVDIVDKNKRTKLKRRSSETKSDASKTSPWVRRLRRRVYLWIESIPMQCCLMVLLLISLFISDSWILGNAPDSENLVLSSILFIIFIIFMFELVILSWVQRGYQYSFFFWMDLIGTISIIFDIEWIVGSNLTKSNISVLRTTRIARIGARYQRLIRLLKLLRESKYLPWNKDNEQIVSEPSLSSVRRVSKELASVLSIRVAALVIIIAIIIPFLNYIYIDYSTNAWIDATLPSLSSSCMNTSSYQLSSSQVDDIMNSIYNFYRHKDEHLYSIYIDTPWLSSSSSSSSYKLYNDNHRNIRNDAKYSYSSSYSCSSSSSSSDDDYRMEIVMDYSIPNQQDALYGILLIVIVIVLLFVFSASFNNAVNDLVIQPLQHMMDAIRKSATSIIRTMKDVEDAKSQGMNGDEEDAHKPSDLNDSDSDDELETDMLEKVIEKLARIAQNVIGDQSIHIAIDDKNIDKATASWLTQTYSTGPKLSKYQAANNNYDDTDDILSDAHAALNASSIDDLNEGKAMTMTKMMIEPAVLNSWDYDVLLYQKEELNETIIYIFKSLNLFEEFQISMKIFHNFLSEVSNKYISSNPYHNYHHGCDVMHTTYRLLASSSLLNIFSKLEILAVLVAAVCHDLGHIGVNNLYLVKAKHELALQHNDRSPLENMHCMILYHDILGKKEFNIFNQLTESQWRDVRKIILCSILSTDMSHHFEQITKTKLFLEVNGDDIKKFCKYEKETIDCFNDESNRIFILELLVHVSDISNPFKPFNIGQKWSNLVMEEFCLQGDREKREGLEVSPMMDRDLINLCNMQLGFIEFVVSPLVSTVINLLPPLHEIGNNIVLSFSQWSKLRKKEIESDEVVLPGTMNSKATILEKMSEYKKIDERNSKFAEKYDFIKDYQASYMKRSRISTNIKELPSSPSNHDMTAMNTSSSIAKKSSSSPSSSGPVSSSASSSRYRSFMPGKSGKKGDDQG